MTDVAGDFSSSSNGQINFKTDASEVAAEKMSLGSGGDLSIVTLVQVRSVQLSEF